MLVLLDSMLERWWHKGVLTTAKEAVLESQISSWDGQLKYKALSSSRRTSRRNVNPQLLAGSFRA